MQDLIISYSEEFGPKNVEKMNKTAKKIFNWLCYTLNCAGYVPHIFECTPNEMRFTLRKVNGTKVRLRFDVQVKLVSIANYFFRVTQNNWPVRIEEDMVGGEYLHSYTIKVIGKERSIFETYEDSLKKKNLMDEPDAPEAESFV